MDIDRLEARPVEGGGSYTASGTIDRQGKITVYAVGATSGAPADQFVSLLSGTAVLQNGAVHGTGTFQTKRGSQTVASGVFETTRA